VAKRQVALTRRPLVVQRDARALGEHELARVDAGLPRDHPQQRRLPRAIAPGQRQPVAALDLERHSAKERLPGNVLAEVGSDADGHGSSLCGASVASAEWISESAT